MKIPYTFKAEDADYITIPALKEFCSKYEISSSHIREELLAAVEEYASQSDERNEETQYWLDRILKVGIKTCIIDKIYTDDMINSIAILDQKIKRAFPAYEFSHICTYDPIEEMQLVNYSFNEDEGMVTKAYFTFIIKLVRATSTYSVTGDLISYPIFVDIDFTNGFYICRAKSIAGLFKISKGNEIDSKNRVYTESLIKDCQELIKTTLGYETEDPVISKLAFKRTIFNILDEYTQTPDVIKEKIKLGKPYCESFAKNIFSVLDIAIDRDNYKDALYDLEIFLEKYSSILYPDESIFIKDREAYPVKFLAQDNEFTKIQETSNGNEDPLQHKKAFFDSKKAVYTDKKCDKICLCHQRIPRKYYGSKPFNVQIYLNKGNCIIKFQKFVEEDDIQNVLSRIIQLYDVQK